MQLKLFKSVLIRMLMSKWMVLVIGISFGLTIIQKTTENDYMSLGINSAFVHVLGFDTSGLGTNLYCLIFPFLASIVGSSAYAQDKLFLMTPTQMIRSSPKKYTITTCVASFIAGGIAANVPYLFQSLTVFLEYPITKMDRFSGWLPIDASHWGYSLFTDYPIAFWGIYVLIIFLFGGIYSLMGYVVSFFSHTKYIETIFPFIVHIFIWLVSSLMGIVEISPLILVSPIQSGHFSNTGFYLILLPIVLILPLVVERFIIPIKYVPKTAN